MSVKTVALRLLAPLQASALEAVLLDCDTCLVVEQNEGAQLYDYLRSRLSSGVTMDSFARPGPVPLNPLDVAEHILETLAP